MDQFFWSFWSEPCLFCLEQVAPLVRALGYAPPLPDVPRRFQRAAVTSTYFTYFLTQCISQLLKMLRTLKSSILSTVGSKQYIYLIPPSKKIFYSHFKLFGNPSYVLFFSSTQFKPLFYSSLLTTLLMIFKIIAGGKSFLY